MTGGRPDQIDAALQEIYLCVCLFMCWDGHIYHQIYPWIPANKAQGLVTWNKTHGVLMIYSVQPQKKICKRVFWRGKMVLF